MRKSKYRAMLQLVLFFGVFLKTNAQVAPKSNWQNLDLKKDSVFGIGMERVYTELLKGRTARPVVVAVIDGGVEITHPDLKSMIYTNKGEIAGNGKDDDGNGYIDDVHGWNFLGSSKGSFIYDNSDGIRHLRAEQAKDAASTETADVKAQVRQKRDGLVNWLKNNESEKKALDHIQQSIKVENPAIEHIKAYQPSNSAESAALVNIVKAIKSGTSFKDYLENFNNRYERVQNNLTYQVNVDYDPRANNPEFNGKFYGNADVGALNPYHGTHVAGILAADRSNNIGLKGVADQVMILPIRAVPDGDFREIDLANAIHYAVDMGAKVINMSIVKGTVINRELIDEAVRYAVSKDVLIIHGSGNAGIEQREESYPNKKLADGTEVKGWIEVAASGWVDDAKIVPWFSNYGALSVDVFAPGVQIYSTWTNNSYRAESGTSMATPVVAGLAAMLRAYYPKFSASQIKDIIMNTVQSRDALKGKCLSGGVVDAYAAFKLAASY